LQVAQSAAPGLAQGVPVHGDAVDHLLARLVARTRGAYDRHLVPSPLEGVGLQPHAPVEGHGQVLDDDQDVVVAGHTMPVTSLGRLRVSAAMTREAAMPPPSRRRLQPGPSAPRRAAGTGGPARRTWPDLGRRT